MRYNAFKTLMIAALAVIMPSLGSCGKKQETGTETSSATADAPHPGGPQLGKPGGGGLDKSSDSTLQAMIKDVVPKFKQFEFKDSVTGTTMKYNLYSPANAKEGAKYPLVMFIADASTPGRDVTLPLTQGYGALVWATDQWQADHPCYVLVPQFDGVAVNDAYEHTPEVDVAIRLLDNVAKNYAVDSNRLYATGQSMGGMISMYYNVAYPDTFAASIFVDCHWDTATFDQLVKHKFVFFIAGEEGHAYADLEPIQEACRKEGVQYTFASWDAQLPSARQSELAAVMLSKGAPVNIFEFEPKTVLPPDGNGSEHMYSFDYAYKIVTVREWLFNQSK